MKYEWIKSVCSGDCSDSNDCSDCDSSEDVLIFSLNGKKSNIQGYMLHLSPFEYFLSAECAICNDPITRTSNMPFFQNCGHVCVCQQSECREKFQSLTKCPVCRSESEISFTKTLKYKTKVHSKK